MRIECPHCGERGVEEFAYRGDASARRPDDIIPESETSPEWQAWLDYVYFRDNPMGLHRELWLHAGGCRSWLVVVRDVRTHAIATVALASDAHGARPEAE